MKKGYRLKAFNKISQRVFTSEEAAKVKAKQIKAAFGTDKVDIVEVNLDAETMTPKELHTWSTDDLITVKRNIQEVLNERAMEDDI